MMGASSMNSCSVILVQYNPNKEKLIRTVKSIVFQKDIQVQIIFADDGSAVDYFQEIRELLQSNGFEDYCFSKNQTNKGTVYNIWNALPYARHRYISFLSPGDYYYDDHTLKDAVSNLMSGNYRLLFGRISPYTWDENGLHLVNRQMPYDHTPYSIYMQTGDDRRIKRNMIVYRDAVIGATCFWDKELFKTYLSNIVGKVVFMEDAVCINAVLDKVKICYLDRYVVWYEYGTGVSTNLNKKWRERINRDDNAFFKILFQQYPQLQMLKRRKVLSLFDGLKGYNSLGLKAILFPDRFLYILIHYVLLKEKMPKQDTSFIFALYRDGEWGRDMLSSV